MAETLTRNKAAASAPAASAIFRATVGEFIFRASPSNCTLEMKIGKVRRVLGLYETEQAAILALQNRRSGFGPWDLMGRQAVAIQLETEARWSRKGGAA